MLNNFHFLNPQWLYLLLPTALILWLLANYHATANDAWQKIIDKNLLPWLRVATSENRLKLPLWLLLSGWVIALISLANPVWEKLPQPVFQTDMARVIVLDLSRSMNSEDLKPSRLDRARFKVSDILKTQQEGVTGLVVFAGDAFVVSPLTRDAGTIRAMLPALQPNIMPVQGSRADLGLLKARELMKQAGRMRGEVVLLADSYTDERSVAAAESLRKEGYITSVMGLGTDQPTPLPTGQGGYYRNNDGELITTRLDVTSMQKLASAGGGRYVDLTANDADIKRLMQADVTGSQHRSGKRSDESFETTRWKETGPWLVILLLPLAALAFRRGWLLSLFFITISVLPNEQAMAFNMVDLWQRHDQQAHKALLAGDAEQASELAQDPLRKGAAEFRKGDYDAAVEAFSSADTAEAAYNKGNALAKMGKLEEAITAYDQALKTQADMQDAEFNRAAVEKLLQQQNKKKNQNKDNQKQENKDSEQKNKEKQDQDGSENNKDDKSNSGEASDKQGDKEGSQQNGKPQDEKQSDGKEQKSDENAFSDAAEQLKKEAAANKNTEQEKQLETEQQEKNTGNASEEQSTEDESMAPQESEEEAKQNLQQNVEEQSSVKNSAKVEAEELSSEEQIAAEQWLRRIPDDPAGLLRRKLRYQYIQRGGDAGGTGDPQPW